MLSPAHAVPDECDDVASGGENGDGIYPQGEIDLPLHPNCICYSDAANVMKPEDFADRLGDWVDGSEIYSRPIF